MQQTNKTFAWYHVSSYTVSLSAVEQKTHIRKTELTQLIEEWLILILGGSSYRMISCEAWMYWRCNITICVYRVLRTISTTLERALLTFCLHSQPIEWNVIVIQYRTAEKKIFSRNVVIFHIKISQILKRSQICNWGAAENKIFRGK